MKLMTYLKKTNTTKSAFARRLGVTRETVSKWTIGGYAPSRRHAKKIIKETAGAVTLAELMDV